MAVLPAVLAATAGAAAAQDAVSLRLNWYLGGLHVPFYYGKERGFFKDEGIDLTINEGRGSANTVQVVAAGSDTFGMADSSSLISLAAKGAEIKSVMSLLNSTGFSVVSLASSGIRTPKDLEGKSLAVSPGDPLGQLFRALAAHNKLDMSTINFVQVDPAAKVVTVLEKRGRRASRRRRRPVLPDQVQGPGAARAALRRPWRQHRRHDDRDQDRHDQEQARPGAALRARRRCAPGRRRRRTAGARSMRR